MGKVERRKVEVAPASFAELLDQGADLLGKIEAAEGAKLNARGFLSAALRIASCDLERLDVVRRQLNEIGADAVASFVRRMSRAFRERQWPGPHPNGEKLVRVFGSSELTGQLANLRITAAECQALAISICGEQHPDAFGKVENWDQHTASLRAAQDELTELYNTLRTAWGPADVEQQPVAVEERDRGLVRICFKRFPGLNPGMDDWPRLAVERVLFERTAPKPKVATKPAATKQQVQAVVAIIANTPPAILAGEASRLSDND